MELELEDVDIDLLQEEKDQWRYQTAINGDNLMKVPFECVRGNKESSVGCILGFRAFHCGKKL